MQFSTEMRACSHPTRSDLHFLFLQPNHTNSSTCYCHLERKKLYFSKLHQWFVLSPGDPGWNMMSGAHKSLQRHFKSISQDVTSHTHINPPADVSPGNNRDCVTCPWASQSLIRKERKWLKFTSNILQVKRAAGSDWIYHTSAARW